MLLRNLRSINKAVNTFFLPNQPVNYRYLSIFRIAISGIALLDILTLLKDRNAFFSKQETLVPQELGYVLTEYFSYLQRFYAWLSNTGMLDFYYNNIIWIYIVCLLLLGAGLFTRIFAFCSLLLQLHIFKSFPLFNYGFDQFLTMSLFYLTIFPSHKPFSLDCFFWKRKNAAPVFNYRRVIQIHLCIVYFFSGLAKSFDANWWDGNSLYRASATVFRDFYTPPAIFFMIAGIFVVLSETLYPFLVAIKRTRKIIIALIILMHIFIGFIMGLYSFALIMITWNIVAFYDFEHINLRTPKNET